MHFRCSFLVVVVTVGDRAALHRSWPMPKMDQGASVESDRLPNVIFINFMPAGRPLSQVSQRLLYRAL